MGFFVFFFLAGELSEQVPGHLQHPAGLPHLLRPLHLRGPVHLHHPLPGVEEHGAGGRGHNAGGLRGHRGGRGHAPLLQRAAGSSPPSSSRPSFKVLVDSSLGVVGR